MTKPYNTNKMSLWHLLLTMLIILAISGTQLNGQARGQKKSFQEVDANTYGLYMKGDWHGLINEGIDALDSGIDYFYLRMRMAYAYFKLGRYRNAIPHYKKALEFNNRDTDAQYFLMLCYEYSGRNNDALKFSSEISDKALHNVGDKYKNDVLKAGIVYSYATANADKAKKEIATNDDLSTYGIQKSTNNFHSTNAFVSHKLGRSIIVSHSLEYLNKSDYDFSTGDGASKITHDQALHQWLYGLNMQITPKGGFAIIPGLNYLNIKVPFDGNSSSDFNTSSVLYSLRLQQELTKFKVGASLFNGKLNHINILQTGVHVTWYPKSNLNLYYAFDGYHKQQKYDEQKKNNFIHKHTIGLKMTDYWWTETSVLLPEFINFYDFSNAALYNSLEGTKTAINLTNLFMIKNSKLTFMAGVSWSKNVSKFVPSENSLSASNSVTYNKLILTGGIIWKL